MVNEAGTEIEAKNSTCKMRYLEWQREWQETHNGRGGLGWNSEIYKGKIKILLYFLGVDSSINEKNFYMR